MSVKFGVLEHTQGLQLHAKFHLNVFIVSAYTVAKNHNFGQILTFWGFLYRPPFTDEGQIRCAIADPQCTQLHAKFRVDRFILSPSGGEKTPLFAVFGLRHLAVSTVGNSLRNLNTVTQLQIFPYPRHQNCFCTQTPSWRNRAHKL